MAGEPALVPPDDWAVYKQLPGIVLGFHGCDEATAEDILQGRKQHLEESRNDYDWLGHGIYFWERDPWRALEWACTGVKSRPVRQPFVIGAAIDLGRCCNLLDYDTNAELLEAWKFVKRMFKAGGTKLPSNRGGGSDRVGRYRDKIVVEQLHALLEERGVPKYQTVRAAFIEGSRLYPGAGFRRKNHIQIAVRDPKCIKGYFRLHGGSPSSWSVPAI